MLIEWDRHHDHAEEQREVNEADNNIEGDGFTGRAANTIPWLLKVEVLATQLIQ